MVSVAQISGYTSASVSDLQKILERPYQTDGDLPLLSGLFLLTLFMSLFPDLDSASVLQRWFYRIILIILIGLFFTGQTGLFAAVTFVSLLPLLHRHRGWTHSKFTPFILAILFAAILEFNRSANALTGQFSPGNMVDWFYTYWIYVLACVAGHYTHLLMDWQF